MGFKETAKNLGLKIKKGSEMVDKKIKQSIIR